MNIYIKHINNTYNYGSCMMATTLIDKIYKYDNSIVFYVDAMSIEDLERLKKETKCNNIYRDNYNIKNKILHKVINKIKNMFVTQKMDIIIIVGGDDISEYYGIKYLEKQLKRLKVESKKKKVILLGQTMGPFSGNRGELARECLMNTKIYTRDDNCTEYLKSLNFKNVDTGRDLAFLPLPNQCEVSGVLNKYGIDETRYITIVPSGLVDCYTSNRECYISEYISIIKYILNKKSLSDCKIVLLPHVLLPENIDDRLVIKEIMNKIDETNRSRIVSIYDDMLPSEAREILARGMFTITGRMHAAVSTFYMRKPAISLSYSVKYAGVIGNGLNMNELIVEASESKLWEERKISKVTCDKIEYVLENYASIIEDIEINVSKTTAIVSNELDNLVDILQRE